MHRQIVAPLFESDARIISLLGPIGPPDINLAVDQLLRLDGESSETITFFLSCQGCGIVDALKLVDTFGLLNSHLIAVGLGLIEAAGALILAAAHQRVLYPSAVVSPAGLWDLPNLHASARRGVGLHQEPDLESHLQDQILHRVGELIAASRGRIPALFANPRARPEVLNASTCIRLGLADAIIHGPQRALTQQPQTNHVKIIKTTSHSPTL